MNACNKTILLDAADSLRTLFGDVRRSVQLGGYVFCGGHADLLDILFRGLNSAAEAGASIDVTEKLNEIVRLTPRRCLLELLEDEFFEMLLMRELDIKAYLRGGSVDREQIEFFRNNFLELEKGIREHK